MADTTLFGYPMTLVVNVNGRDVDITHALGPEVRDNRWRWELNTDKVLRALDVAKRPTCCCRCLCCPEKARP
jgi:hypothetical protein